MEEEKEYLFHVGIDWGTKVYVVCILGRSQRVLQKLRVEHTGTAILEFADLLAGLAPRAEDVAAAIETPRGAMVETLIERSFHVFAVNPLQMKGLRTRYNVSGARDDRRDAFVLADSLRTSPCCFRRVQTSGPLVIQLREAARMGEELAEEMNRLSNRLREQLHRFFPQMLRLVPPADEPWLWDLVELVPTPEKARTLRPSKVKALLRRHRIRRLGAEKVIEELRTPSLRLASGSVEACVAHIRLLLPQLRFIKQQQTACTRNIGRLLKKLDKEEQTQKGRPSDLAILLSMRGLGRVTAVTLLTEASHPLKERDYETLRAIAGVAPVTQSSGMDEERVSQWKTSPGLIKMRRACNIRLRNAVFHWARVSAQREPHKEYYQTLRRRGHGHPRALRSVADRLLRILMACLKNGTTYDAKLVDRKKNESRRANAADGS